MSENIYIDEPCVVTFFTGELGWLIQRWQAHMRYLKHQVYPDRKFLMMMNIQFHPLVSDFVTYTIDLPKEFYELGLETDCYDAPMPNSPPASLTPPKVYASLIEYIRNFYNIEKAIEIWTPRGYSEWVDHRPQIFTKYDSTREFPTDKPMLTICPRARARASNRNVPEFVWREAVDILKKDFYIVLCGTPSGSCLADYEDKENVLNLVSYSDDDKFELCMEYIAKSRLCISSQSGLTHVGLMCDTPSYIIGHEKTRHTITDNKFGVPTSFRYVFDYRAIDAETIVRDITEFYNILKNKWYDEDTSNVDKDLEDGIESFENIIKEEQDEE